MGKPLRGNKIRHPRFWNKKQVGGRLRKETKEVSQRSLCPEATSVPSYDDHGARRGWTMPTAAAESDWEDSASVASLRAIFNFFTGLVLALTSEVDLFLLWWALGSVLGESFPSEVEDGLRPYFGVVFGFLAGEPPDHMAKVSPPLPKSISSSWSVGIRAFSSFKKLRFGIW